MKSAFDQARSRKDCTGAACLLTEQAIDLADNLQNLQFRGINDSKSAGVENYIPTA